MANLDIKGSLSEHNAPQDGMCSATGGTANRDRAPVSTERKGHLACRMRDVLFVMAAVPAILPMLFLIAAMIKIDDPKGPIFYRQRRFGLRGAAFDLLKFRTMVPDADARKAELVALSEDKGAGFKLENDPRVTRPGRLLRSLYLDELPQLWNVLRGEMSLVGPRPNSFSPETYEPWQRERLEVAPGLTGSWQVMDPKPRDFETRCRIDIDYVRTRSFFGDIAILFRTLQVCVIRQTGS